MAEVTYLEKCTSVSDANISYSLTPCTALDQIEILLSFYIATRTYFFLFSYICTHLQ